MSTPEVKQAKKIAIILGLMMVTTLCSLIFGYYQKEKGVCLQNQIDSLRMELKSLHLIQKAEPQE